MIAYLFGVSPAYYISRFGTRFSVDDVCASLPLLSQMGYQGYQAEVYYEENLKEWLQGAARVQQIGSDFGLKASQFVAHFMLHYFSKESLFSEKGLAEIHKVIEITGQFDGCNQITVPVGPYDGLLNLNSREKEDLKQRAIDKLFEIFQAVERAGLKMALEILPGALISIRDDFNAICGQFDSPNIGLNLDPGHANASKEDVHNLPLLCRSRIIGTHLCDNFGTENLSLRPGTGSVQWEPLIGNLVGSGYQGWMDIEIHCKPGSIEEEYRAAKIFLEDLLGKVNAA